MLTREQIESAILQLPPNEYQQLLEWFFDLDYQRWNEQLEKDITNGKLENLAQEAIADFGNATTLCLKPYREQPIDVTNYSKLTQLIHRCISKKLVSIGQCEWEEATER